MIRVPQVRVLLDDEEAEHRSIADCQLRGGYTAYCIAKDEANRELLINEIEKSQLIGKGGAGYPTHRKMRLMLSQTGARKILVVNGSEHEPGSVKDRYLLENYPHKVLEGALIAAYAVAATEIVIAVNESSTLALASLAGAVEELQATDLTRADVSIIVKTVPEIYIVGEETALLETLEGKKPLPRVKPPFPIVQGLYGVPTLVQNVETVAHLPFIFLQGAVAYRDLGPSSKGVTLCTLGEEFATPGVYEITLGTSIHDILYLCGNGLRNGLEIKCIQPGGPSSGFLSSSNFALPLDPAALSANGTALGCAVIRAYSVDECMVRRVGEIMHFFAHASCGQCPKCRMETNMLDTIIRQVHSGSGSRKLLDKVEDIIKFASGQGICSLISMPVAPIRTALQLFHEEFTAHLDNGCTRCAAHGVAADADMAAVTDACHE